MKLFSVGVEATGVIAVGQMATGVIAIGQIATGVIAVGQLARGVVAVGQLAVGIVAAGQLGVGFAYGAGMVGVGGVAGGLLPGGVWGVLPFKDAFGLRLRRTKLARSRGPWRLLAWLTIGAVVWFATVAPLWESLYGAGGLFYQKR